MLQKLYQDDYIGEFIITDISVSAGKKTEKREWIEPTFHNENHNNVAHVIGNGETRRGFNLQNLAEVHGGLLAKEMGQSYGCNALYRDFEPDFLILSSETIADEFSSSFPNENTIAVSWTKQLLKHPGRFHLMPYNVRLCAGASAAYLACFHGHKKIYLIGFDNQPDKGLQNNIYAGTNGYSEKHQLMPDSVFIKDMNELMKTYNDVEFIRVQKFDTYPIPEEWKWRENFSQINYRQYISLCDFGVALHYLKK